MPTIAITRVTVSEVWDNDTINNTHLAIGSHDTTGDGVSINDDSSTIIIKRRCWPAIREQIDALFAENQ